MEGKRVLGLIGPVGSGKSIVSNSFIEKYGFYRIMMGNLVRAVAKKENIPINRKSLQDLAKRKRKKYGEGYFINIAIDKAKKSKNDRVVIDGMRTLTDVVATKKELDAKIILVDAKTEIRFNRLKKRRRKGFSKTLKQFELEEKNEPGYDELKKTLKHVDYTLENNTTEPELHKEISTLMKKLKIKQLSG